MPSIKTQPSKWGFVKASVGVNKTFWKGCVETYSCQLGSIEGKCLKIIMKAPLLFKSFLLEFLISGGNSQTNFNKCCYFCNRFDKRFFHMILISFPWHMKFDKWNSTQVVRIISKKKYQALNRESKQQPISPLKTLNYCAQLKCGLRQRFYSLPISQSNYSKPDVN